MLQTLRETGSRICTTTMSATKRAPVEVLLTVSMTVAIVVDIYGVQHGSERVVFPMILAWLLSFSISCLHALGVVDSFKRWSLTGAYLAGCAVYGVFFFDTDLTSSAWRYTLFAAASFLAVTLVPLLAKMGDSSASERFWRFNTRLLSRGVVALVFSGAICIGLVIALIISDTLFGLTLEDEVYQVLSALSFVGLGGMLMAGAVDDVTRIDEPIHEPSLRWIGRLGTFVLVPLTILYLGIVYVYLGQVFVSAETPSNVLSPLIIGSAAMGYGGLFLLWPFIEERESALMNTALKWFPAALLPTLPVAMWAVLERVNQYGWTEFRYVRMMTLVCLVLFSSVAVIRVVRKQGFSLTSAPTILAAAALFSAVGPWSAIEVSQRSQTTRFVEAATEAGLMQQGMLVIPDGQVSLSGEQATQIHATMTYLVDNHGVEALQHLTATALEDRMASHEVSMILGINRLVDSDAASRRWVQRHWDESFLIRADGRFHKVDLRDGNFVDRDGWLVGFEGPEVVAHRNDVTYRVSLASLMNRSSESEREHLNLPPDELTYSIGAESDPDAQLFIQEASFVRTEGIWAVESLRAHFLLPD